MIPRILQLYKNNWESSFSRKHGQQASVIITKNRIHYHVTEYNYTDTTLQSIHSDRRLCDRGKHTVVHLLARLPDPLACLETSLEDCTKEKCATERLLYEDKK